MLRADRVIAAGAWSGEPADSVVLDFDERYRRRFVMTGVGGLAFLLDLPEAAMLRGGDGLKLEDGRIVEVVAAPEPLAEIRAADALGLMRVAWHLGNRHLPTELMPKALRIRRDAIIEEMAKGLGAQRDPARSAVQSGRRRLCEGRGDRPRATAMIVTATRMITGMTITITLTMITITTTTTIMDTTTTDMGAAEADPSLMPLMLWLSPAFPVGAFAYSHGLEWAVEAGDIHDARSLGGWLVDLLTFGAPRADAILFAAALPLGRSRRLARALRDATRLPSRSRPRPNGASRRRRKAPLSSPRRAPPGIASRSRRLAPEERDRLSGRGRRRRRGPWPAARSEPSGLRAGARRQRRLRRGAARPDRPDRRPEDPGRAPAETPRARA